jgi:kynureninase
LVVGGKYKHLNAGPGAPAFLYVRADLQAGLRQPIWGWFGQRNQFAMGERYDPKDGIEGFLVGTTPVLGGYAALEGARLTAEAGIPAIAAKAATMTSYAVDLMDGWLAKYGFTLASPRDPARRGAHICLHHPQAWQICQAWKAAKVIPDFRVPDRIRIGPSPLYTRFVEVYEAFDRLRSIVDSGEYERFAVEHARVT